MYDLNMRLKSSKEKDMRMTVKRLFELGWDCVAWNNLANGRVSANISKPVEGIALEPIQRRAASALRSLVTSSTATSDIRQLNRITVTVDDVIDAQSLTVGNAILNSFDIVAARPGNMKVMAYLCKTAEIDIITLDLTHRLPFAANKKLLDEAIKRGIFIEILYSPIIGSSSGARLEVFSNTRILIQYLRGRNIILSSGADNLSQIRGPMDVCNIGVALGLTREQAMNAIANNCATVIKHAVARKCRYLPLEIVSRINFKLRFPEISMENSQSNNHNVPIVLSENILLNNDEIQCDIDDDDNDEDDRDDKISDDPLSFATSSFNLNFSSVAGMEREIDEINTNNEDRDDNDMDSNDNKNSDDDVRNGGNDIVYDENDDDENIIGYEMSVSGDQVGLKLGLNVMNTPKNASKNNFEVDPICHSNNIKLQDDEVEAMDAEDEDEEDSFDLGDSFISFSSSKKRIYDDQTIEEENEIVKPVLKSKMGNVLIKSTVNTIKKIKINSSRNKLKKMILKKIKK